MYSKIYGKFIMPYFERRQGYNTAKPYRELKRSEKWSTEELRHQQLLRLKGLLHHAYYHTLFYKRRFDKEGIRPEDIRKIEDIQYVPIVTREDLNENIENMIAQNIPSNEIHHDSTGGSTGLSTQFARDDGCLSIKKASEYRFNSWTGWRPGEKILYYWPALADYSGTKKRPWITKDMLWNRKIVLYAGKLSQRILKDHLKRFIKFKPQLVRCFPNALQIFAEYIVEKGVYLRVDRGVISVGEPLNEYQRVLFKQAFSCEVYNCYVSRECGNTACECEAHEGMHVSDELLYLEINATKKGGVGKILITDLHNMGMPLIRYDIQDASQIYQGECSCGRKLTRISLDAARMTDYLISPVDGSLISGSTLVHYLLAEGPKVGRFQVVQDKQNHLQIKMTGRLEDNESGIAHISNVIDNVFKGQMKLDFDFVESIPFLPSGKYRFIQRDYRHFDSEI